MNTLGQRIRELRSKKEMTQMDLSKGLCTPSMISQIESDRARPSYKVLFAIAERLDVSLDKLLVDVNLDMETSSKYKMALALVQAREYVSAIPILEEMIDEARGQNPELEALYELGNCYLHTGRDQEAAAMFTRVLDASLQREELRMVVSALVCLGAVAARKQEYQIAIYHSHRALEECAKLESPEPPLKARVLFQTASIYQEIGQVEDAVRYFQEALSCYEGCSDLEGIGRTYLSLSETYQKSGDWERSSEYATLSLAILKTRNHIQTYEDVKRQLLVLERHQKSWELSVRELTQFAARYEEQKEWMRAAETYADIAGIFLENERLAEAKQEADKVLKLLSAPQRALGKAHQVLAFVHFRSGEADLGREHLDEAMGIFEGLGLLAELEEITLHLCHYLDQQGEHQEAFKRLEKFHDILHNKLRKRGIAL